MNYFLAAVAGAIQGVTEFLPVSSSGHLVLFHDLFAFDLPDTLAFDVVLHLGTLLALLLFFWNDVVRYVAAWFKSLGSARNWNDVDQRLAWYLLLGTIPAGLAGFFLESWIDSQFRSIEVVAVMLIVFGIALWAFDRLFRHDQTLERLGWGSALVIGCAQALALIPGVSRSGVTIIAGLSQKLNREAAARFSFLLSMPIVAAAGAKKMIDVVQAGTFTNELGILLTGFIVSAVTGYLTIRFFLGFLQRHSLAVFAWYRVGLGLAILIFVGLTR